MQLLQIYMDVESAKAAGRTEFGRLVEFLRIQSCLPSGRNPCRTVLVEKTDRFYRNIHDLVVIRDLGVSVHLAKENVIMSPASKSHDTFVHGINVLVAERMVNNLSEETQKGMLEKARQGIWPSSAPIGFKNVEGRNGKRIIEQDSHQAPLVRKMFEQYATGIYSLKDICTEAHRIGLVHKKSGNKITKSAMYDILNNPIYYGDFYWKGVLYNGTHQPVITKDLFDRVQRALDRRSSCPTGRQKHDFTFQGMLTCGHCGCAVVAEIHKGKYVYYRCTHNKGKCPDKYAREEIIEQQFLESLGGLKVDEDVIDWIVTVMKSSVDEGRRNREAQVDVLTQQRQRLENRLEKMYEDRLDGIISDEEYMRLSKKARTELTELKFRTEQLTEEKADHIDSGRRILELAQKAASLYSAQIPAEKRKLLNSVYSNSSWGGGRLTPNFRKPFNLIAESNQEYQRKKVTSQQKSDLLEIWRPLPDLNRCRRRERAVSWAGLDEGDVSVSITPVPLKRSGPCAGAIDVHIYRNLFSESTFFLAVTKET